MHQRVVNEDGASSQQHRGGVRRVAAACIALLLCGLMGLAAVPAQSAEGALPKITGTFPRYGADIAKAVGVADLKEASEASKGDRGVALIYPKLDRLYQLYNLIDPAHYGDLVIAERDLATFKLLRVLKIDNHWAKWANGANGAEWVTTFDGNNDRLYIVYEPHGGLNVGADPERMPGLIGLDLHTFTYTDSRFPNFVAATGDQLLHLVGLEFDEKTDTLLILQAAIHNAYVFNSLVLVGWKSEELLKGGQLPTMTPRPIRACRRDPLNEASSQYLSPILIAEGPDIEGDGSIKSWVMVPCYSSTYSSTVVIARMERSAALDPKSTAEKAIVAPPSIGNWAADQKHGRMYLLNNTAETDAWVYEAATNAFVGIVALSEKGHLEANSMSLGIDESSGRLYARAQSYGLMIVAGAQDPVPQADVYPKLSATGSYRLLVDAKRNRLLSLTGHSAAEGGGADFYEVVQVPPPLPAPAKQDPDKRTAQIDEEPGKTTAQYGGNASAYGLRVLLARGAGGAVPSMGVDKLGANYSSTNSYCGFTDRELVFARVSKTELSNNSRFARAAALDVDNATVVDLGDPARCDLYTYANDENINAFPEIKHLHSAGLLADVDKRGLPASKTVTQQVGPHTRWDYTAADCSTDGQDTAGPNSSRAAGDTGVKCREEDEITAAAEAKLKPADGMVVSAKRTTAKTRVYRDKDKGLVSEATSRVEGIKIGDISIGFIEQTARSFARGRTGTARTEFSAPKIGFVDGPGVASCSNPCDVAALVRQLNNVFAGRAEFRRIKPEESLAKGTPGGYQAGILKSEKQVASDNSLTGDKSVEVPALEMVVYNDNAKIGRARQLYQFAGVRADSYYGIQVVGSGTGGLDGDPSIGDVIDGATGSIDPLVGGLPNDGVPLKVRVPKGGENVLKRTVRQASDYAEYSLRIIFNNPREALVMATVWLLMWGPLVSSRRRRALKAVIASNHEGPSSR